MKKKMKVSSFVLIIFIAACVTVNIYFPAAAVQKAADEIVEDVRGVEKKEEQLPEGRQDSKRFYQELKVLYWGPREAHAQIDVKVSTPAIRALKQSMKERFPSLKPFYDKGSIGENNMGLVEVRDVAGLNLKGKADLNRLLAQENKEREELYEEIMKANKFGPDVLPQIHKIFANSWREKSQSGWWIQKDNDEWVKK